MAVIFPLAAAAMLWLFLFSKLTSWREAFISSTVIWGVLLVASTESLSRFHAYAFPWVVLFWSAVIVVLAGLLLRRRSELLASFKNHDCPHLAFVHWALIAAIALFALALLVNALLAPPNTWDVMTYHMPRVFFWVQNHTVATYPTHVSRQIEFPPFAEFVIAQYQILLKSDRMANFPQWFALFGSMIVSSLLAKHLGAGARGQILAAVVSCTMPTGILQASGAKNDYVAAYWSLCSVLTLLNFSRSSDARRWIAALQFGAAVGLAMLTKATTYMFLWPLLLVLTSLVIWRFRWRSLAPLALAGCIALALNTPHFVRTYKIFGDFFGSPSSHRTMENKHWGAWVVLSNAIRNAAVHLATPSPWFNQHFLYDPVVQIHHWMGHDPSDPDTTCDPRFTSFAVNWGYFIDDSSGSGLHVLLVTACLFLIPVVPRFRKNRIAVALALALLMSYLTFCFLINYQPWHPRYHIVLFILWSPILGLFLESLPRTLGYAISFILIAGAVPYVLFNHSRPLVASANVFNTPRNDLYFFARPNYREPYMKLAAYIASTGSRQVGILSGADSWFYPLPVLLNQSMKGPTPRFDYLNDFPWPSPSIKVRAPRQERSAKKVVVVLKAWDWGFYKPAPKILVENNGERYWFARDFGPCAVFTRKQQSLADKIFLDKGWLGIEHISSGWASWTAGNATFTLVRDQNGPVLLEGEMNSVPVPNKVTFLVDGVAVADVHVDWKYNRHFGPIRLPLKAGDNTIEIISQQPAEHIGKDPRSLAVLLSNLTLHDEHDSQPVPLQPVSTGGP